MSLLTSLKKSFDIMALFGARLEKSAGASPEFRA